MDDVDAAASGSGSSSAHQRFLHAIEDEILWRIKGGVYYITRDRVKEIATQAGITRIESALAAFQHLKGILWEGRFSNHPESRVWTEVFFDVGWFQRTGKVLVPGAG